MSTGDEGAVDRSDDEYEPDEHHERATYVADSGAAPLHASATAPAPDPSGADGVAETAAPEPRIPGDPVAAVETITGTRAGRWWVGVAASLPVLAVGLVFILQNTHKTKVSFFTASGNLPVGVALLIATLLGALVVLLIGTVRIVQLRRTLRRREAARHPPRARRFGGRRNPGSA